MRREIIAGASSEESIIRRMELPMYVRNLFQRLCNKASKSWKRRFFIDRIL